MNPTTAERELTNEECDAIEDSVPFPKSWMELRRFNRALIRAGWQARAGAVPREPCVVAYLRPALRGPLAWETCSPDRAGAFPVYAPSPPGPSDEANQGALPVAPMVRVASPEIRGEMFGVTIDERYAKSRDTITLLCEDDGNWFEKLSFDAHWLPDLLRVLQRADVSVSREGLPK